MLNKIILIGRMTKDPEKTGRDPEKPIANIRIAVDRDFKRDGGPDADYFTCVAFGQQAKFILQYLSLIHIWTQISRRTRSCSPRAAGPAPCRYDSRAV